MNTTAAISICSNALVLLGHSTISSFDEEGIGAKVASNFYETSLLAKLGEYNWNFATKQKLLTKLSSSPQSARWLYMYQLPTDHIRTLTTLPHSDYTIMEDKVYSDNDNLELEYIFRPDESFFPPLFREALEYYLASKFAIPVTENATNAEIYGNQFSLSFRKAKGIDSLETPNRGATEVASLPYRMKYQSGRSLRGRR